MSKTAHVHKLKRLKYKSGNTIYFCALPDCTFKTNISLALGKRSLCWRCGEPFIMDEYSIRLAKPHCPACHKPKADGKAEADWVHEPSEKEKEAVKELVNSLSLADRLSQTIKQAQTTTEQEEEI